AREQIERLLGTKVFLEMFVKVQAGWRDSRGFVEELDWRRQLEHISHGMKKEQPEPESDE
ncbi:MAG TPA: GTPase Era, partial [Candidatus Angelobacter sp.]|nr:GTPase Era [Candidatus Angelobacter sp.]